MRAGTWRAAGDRPGTAPAPAAQAASTQAGWQQEAGVPACAAGNAGAAPAHAQAVTPVCWVHRCATALPASSPPPLTRCQPQLLLLNQAWE